MRHIVIIGQSVTAVKAVELLRAHDQESRVTLVGFGPDFAALPERFPEWIARQINRAQVFYQNENFYRNLRVECVTDKKIDRINLNRRMVVFEDKDRLEADVLILAGAEKNRFPDIKGTNKEGVFSLQTIDQVDALLKKIGNIDTIVIESQTLNGVRFAQALLAQDKEVILCLPRGTLLPGEMDAVTADFAVTVLEQAGVRVLRKSTIQEVLGEADVKAVRLNIGKVIAAEVVIFPDALPDIRLYRKSGLDGDTHLKTTGGLQTSSEAVYAVDRVGDWFQRDRRFGSYDDVCRVQAQQLSAAILGQEPPEEDGILQVCLEIGGQEVCLIGDISGQGAEAFSAHDQNGLLAKRLFLKNNVVLGAVLVNNSTITQRLACLISERQSIDPEHDELIADCVKDGQAVNSAQPYPQEEDKADAERDLPAADREPEGEFQT